MQFEYSRHWERKRKIRNEITDDIIEICIKQSEKIRDKEWVDVWNAIARIQPSGRKLKVVYKTKGKGIKILTAYWLE